MRTLVVSLALMFGFVGGAGAATYETINLFSGGVPGTGGKGIYYGPCYCETTVYYSPVYLIPAGTTVYFGTLDLYWVESGPTPDAGPDQPYFFILSPVAVSYDPPLTPLMPFQYQTEFPSLFPTQFGSCGTYGVSGGGCGLYSGYSVNPLLFTIPTGSNAVQLAWFADYYRYDPGPVPIGPTLPLFLSGLALFALFGWRRGARDGRAELGSG